MSTEAPARQALAGITVNFRASRRNLTPSARMKLIIEDEEGQRKVVPVVWDEITIGREDGNTIRLPERNVSRRHARLVRDDGFFVIEDLGSHNGGPLNGDRICAPRRGREGELIPIGEYDPGI